VRARIGTTRLYAFAVLCDMPMRPCRALNGLAIYFSCGGVNYILYSRATDLQNCPGSCGSSPFSLFFLNPFTIPHQSGISRSYSSYFRQAVRNQSIPLNILGHLNRPDHPRQSSGYVIILLLSTKDTTRQRHISTISSASVAHVQR
jgi:hypothetical protein